MKMKVVKSVFPFVLLIGAMFFMTEYKQLETLSASEAYQIDVFQQEAEAAAEEQTESLTASAETSAGMESVQTEQPKTETAEENNFAVTSDGSIVRVYNDSGDQVYQTTLTDWEQNREQYYEKYKLGS